MRKSTMFNLFVVAILGLVLPDRAFGQQKPLKDLLVGTWLQVSVDVVSTDGTSLHLASCLLTTHESAAEQVA